MDFYHAGSLTAINTAITAASQVHGGYRALALLADALEDVRTPESFETELHELRSRQGPSYQGPEEADRELLKAAHTAAHEEGEKQDAILELMSLVLIRLGANQGSRILSMLLIAAGLNPLLMPIVLKLCLLLAQSEPGRRMILNSRNRFRELMPAARREARWRESLESLHQTLGEQSAELWDRVGSWTDSLWPEEKK